LGWRANRKPQNPVNLNHPLPLPDLTTAVFKAINSLENGAGFPLYLLLGLSSSLVYPLGVIRHAVEHGGVTSRKNSLPHQQLGSFSIFKSIYECESTSLSPVGLLAARPVLFYWLMARHFLVYASSSRTANQLISPMPTSRLSSSTSKVSVWMGEVIPRAKFPVPNR
jgi:hypothetical protein